MASSGRTRSAGGRSRNAGGTTPTFAATSMPMPSGDMQLYTQLQDLVVELSKKSLNEKKVQQDLVGRLDQYKQLLEESGQMVATLRAANAKLSDELATIKGELGGTRSYRSTEAGFGAHIQQSSYRSREGDAGMGDGSGGDMYYRGGTGRSHDGGGAAYGDQNGYGTTPARSASGRSNNRQLHGTSPGSSPSRRELAQHNTSQQKRYFTSADLRRDGGGPAANRHAGRSAAYPHMPQLDLSRSTSPGQPHNGPRSSDPKQHQPRPSADKQQSAEYDAAVTELREERRQRLRAEEQAARMISEQQRTIALLESRLDQAMGYGSPHNDASTHNRQPREASPVYSDGASISAVVVDDTPTRASASPVDERRRRARQQQLKVSPPRRTEAGERDPFDSARGPAQPSAGAWKSVSGSFQEI